MSRTLQTRVGIGYDIHRMMPTIKSGSIPVGGTDIPCFYKVQAHSDGDVLLHAIVDACLGALALGDVGQWFPDNAPEHAGKKSSEFVAPVVAEMKKLGFAVVQIDSNIMLEEPKLAPHMDKIRQGLAQLFKIELSSVSVKARTMEGLGAIGERKALSAQAVVVLKEIL